MSDNNDFVPVKSLPVADFSLPFVLYDSFVCPINPCVFSLFDDETETIVAIVHVQIAPVRHCHVIHEYSATLGIDDVRVGQFETYDYLVKWANKRFSVLLQKAHDRLMQQELPF